jgi:rod shape determining protein RodA
MHGSLIVIGIVTMFAFQIFENIGMNMGVMPVTGIPLPFVSSGGTAVAANMLAIGLVLNVGIRNKTINF